MMTDRKPPLALKEGLIILIPIVLGILIGLALSDMMWVPVILGTIGGVIGVVTVVGGVYYED